MASLNVQAPDGKTLTVDVPQGTDPKQYGALADDALSHYKSVSAPSEGSMGSFLRGIGNQLPLGNQFAALVSKGPYSQNMQAINDATTRDKSQNPVAYGSGAVTGAVAPALIPGVGEAMAANPGTAGALLGGSQAVNNTDLQQHPLLGAAQIAGGAASGAVLNKVLSMIMPSAQNALESKANNLANKYVNSDDLINMTEAERQSQGSALRDAGIIVKNKEEAFNKADDLLNSYGNKIRSVANTTQGEGLAADAEQHYGSITNLLNKAQEFAGSANKVSKAIGRDYKAGAEDLLKLGDNPSWDAIQSLKEKYGSFAFKDTATKGSRDTYFALSNMLKGIADKAQSNPNLGSEYKQALAGYSQMAPIVDNLKDAANAELSGKGAGMGVRGMIGLIRQLPGPARAAIGATAAVAGHPYIAGMAAIPELTNKALQSQASGAVASAIPGIQKIAAVGGTDALTSPVVQAKISDLINQLKQKYDSRRKM